jgi:hypothetical protein
MVRHRDLRFAFVTTLEESTHGLASMQQEGGPCQSLRIKATIEPLLACKLCISTHDVRSSTGE